MQLAGADGTPRLADELARRGLLHRQRLRQLGIPLERGEHLTVGPWLVAPGLAKAVADRLPTLVQAHARAHPLDPAAPLTVLASQLRLPTPDLVRALVRPPLEVVGGRVIAPGADGLPPKIRKAVEQVRRDLSAAPFAAPTADRLRELASTTGPSARPNAATVVAAGPGIVLLPDAADTAVELLGELDQPFTTSAARERLGTTRRVVLPLLDRLDKAGRTRRLPDDRREIVR